MHKYCKLSQYKTEKILRYFSEDLTATQTSKLTRLNRKTVNRFYRLFREKIFRFSQTQLPVSGEVELDESYFGGRFKGKPGRGSQNKIPVFGILKRNGKVYTQIIPNASAKVLKPIIKRRVEAKSTIYTDRFKSYDGLIFDGYEHYRINHSKEFARGRNHINGIESFWSFAKRRLNKLNRIRAEHFYLHIKECEFRFNYRHKNLYDILRKVLKKY